jgi:hypothetical protein
MGFQKTRHCWKELVRTGMTPAKPAYWCRGEAPQRLAEKNITCAGTDRLAPPPVRQMDPVSLGRRSIPPPS